MSVFNTIGKPFIVGFGLWTIKQQIMKSKVNIQLPHRKEQNTEWLSYIHF